MIEFKEGIMTVSNGDVKIEFKSDTEVSYYSYGNCIKIYLASVNYDYLAVFILDISEHTISLKLSSDSGVNFENYCLSSVGEEYLINEIIKILELKEEYIATMFTKMIREAFWV